MSIQPGIATSPGTLAGQTDRMADYNRRIAALEAARTVFRGPVITGSMVAAGAIQAGHLSANSVTAGAIAAGSIIAEHISSGAINAGHISADSINTVHLVAGAITANEIAALSIQAGHIVAGAVQATHIAAGTIEAQHILAGAVIAEKIAAGAIITEKLAVDSVTAEKINVTTLDAITTNMGSITAGTITGATVQSASTGPRVVQDSLGIRGYALDGITKTFEINTGTGIASFVGIATLDANSVVPTGTLSGFLSGGNLVSNSSFEQGVNPDTGADQWFEGWVEVNATVAKNTANHMHGSQSAALTALGGDTYLQLTTAKRIRVRPGRRYYGSAYTKAAATTRPTYIFVTYYDASGTQLSQSNSAGITNSTTEFVRATYLAPAAPASAAFADIIVYIGGSAAGEVHYVDGVQFEEGDTLTAYQPLATEILYSSIRSVFIGAGQVKANNVEAGAIKAQHISVQFGGNNVLFNSRVQNALTNWNLYQNAAGNTILRDAAVGRSNLSSIRLDSAATSSQLGSVYVGERQRVTPGSTWTASGYGRTNTAAQQGFVILAWYDANGAYLGGIEGSRVTLTTAANSWTRVSSTGVAPSNAVTVGMYVVAQQISGAALPTGGSYWYTDMQIEQGEIATGYAPRPDEILPGSVGATQITPSSITADRMVAGTITAASGIIADAAITNAKIVSVDAEKITTGFLDAARIQAGTITADKITVSLSGANRLLNSNFNDGLTGRGTTYTRWYGVYEATGVVVLSSIGYPGQTAIYGTSDGSGAGAHIYTPYVECGFQSKVSASMWSHSGYARVRRLSVEFFDINFASLAASSRDSVSTSQWYRSVYENIAVPAGAYYVRFYLQVVATVSGEVVHFSAAQIEFSEKATSWGLATEDIPPNSITTTKILPGSITTGTLSATAIDGMTVTGATIRTSAANPRIEMTTGGVRQYNASGVNVVSLVPDQGIDILSAVDPADMAQLMARGISWKNDTGYRHSAVYSFSASGAPSVGTTLSAKPPNSTWSALARITASDSADTMKAQVEAQFSRLGENFHDVTVTAGSQFGILLRADGYSSWIQREKEAIIGGHLTINSYSTSKDRRISVAGGLTYGIVVESSSWIGTYSESSNASGYDFYAAGAAINYGPFTGSHDVRLRGAPENFLPGMLVSSTGTVARRQKSDGELSLSTTLPQVELASVANAKAVFGVFAGERRPDLPDQYYVPEPGERLGIVNALGEGRVLVCDMNGEINNGDYIVPGPIPGIGVRQNDDILRSSTAAKATEPSMFASRPTSFTYEGRPVKTKLLACTYHCG